MDLKGQMGQREDGGFDRPWMLRRYAQLYLCLKRGINHAELGREMGLTREAVRLYFAGSRFVKGPNTSPKDLTEEEVRAYRDDFEDRVERAIEAISAARNLSPGPLEHAAVADSLTQEHMRRPFAPERGVAV